MSKKKRHPLKLLTCLFLEFTLDKMSLNTEGKPSFPILFAFMIPFFISCLSARKLEELV